MSSSATSSSTRRSRRNNPNNQTYSRINSNNNGDERGNINRTTNHVNGSSTLDNEEGDGLTGAAVGFQSPVTPPQKTSRSSRMSQQQPKGINNHAGGPRYNMIRSNSGGSANGSVNSEKQEQQQQALSNGGTNNRVRGNITGTTRSSSGASSAKKPPRRGYDHVATGNSSNHHAAQQHQQQQLTISPLSAHTRQSSLFSLNLTPQPHSSRQVSGNLSLSSPATKGGRRISNAANSTTMTRPGQYYNSGGFIIGAGSGISGVLPDQQAGPELHPATQAYYQQVLGSFNLLEPVLNPFQDSSQQQQSHDIWTTLWNSELLGGEGELEEYDPDAYLDHDADNPIAELEKYVTDISTNLGGWMSALVSGGQAAAASTTSPSRHQSQQQNQQLTPGQAQQQRQQHHHHQSNNPLFFLASTMGSSSSHGGGGYYYDPSTVPDFLAKLDLSDFHRFMGRTGPLATKFVTRGEQLAAQYHVPEEEEEEHEEYYNDYYYEEKDDTGAEEGEDDDEPDVVDEEEGEGENNDINDNGDAMIQANNIANKEIPFLPSIDDSGKSPVQQEADSPSKQRKATPTRRTRTKKKGKGSGDDTMYLHKPTPEERWRAKLLNKKNYPLMLECEEKVPAMFFMEDYDLARPLNFEHLMTHLDQELGGMELMFPLDTNERKARREQKKRHKEEKKAARRQRKEERRARREKEEEEEQQRQQEQQNGDDVEHRQYKNHLQQRGETTEELSARGREKRADKTKKDKNKKKKKKADSSDLTQEERQSKLEERRQRKQVLQSDQMALLSSYLDSVEMSLLEQVRSKSQAYFTETSRFAELKTLVKDGCDQVVFLKSVLVELQLCNVEDVERIPHNANIRLALEQLRHLFELCDNVASTKASVAGLLSMNDTRGAIEAVRGARLLLAPPPSSPSSSPSTSMKSQQTQQQEEHENDDDHPNNYSFVLGDLRALSGVNQQLGEYERIVVESLSTTLVDLFLSWELSSVDTSTSLFDSFGLSSSELASTTLSTNTANTLEQSKQARTLIESLALCHRLSQTHNLYVNKLCEVLKVTVKTTVQECAADAKRLNNLNKSLAAGSGDGSSSNGEKQQPPQKAPSSGGISSSVSNMTFEQFMDCLDMLFEQILSRLRSALAVSKFLRQEGLVLRDDVGGNNSNSNTGGSSSGGDATTNSSSGDGSSSTDGANTANAALATASELAHKSISEVLRLKKDAHSLLSLEEMQRLWDSCLTFTIQLEKMSNCKAYGLRSTLLAQTKAFVERQHQSHMTSLVAALDSEKWVQCHVSDERQASLTRLCTGRAVLLGSSSSNSTASSSAMLLAGSTTSTKTGMMKDEKKTDSSVGAGGEEAKNDGNKQKASSSSSKREVKDAEVKGTNYKVVWSCLLLVEMVMKDISCAAHFQTLATTMVGKIVELLRLFNTRSTQLVLGAGAIHSSAKLKSINAKHLALVTQCLGMMIALLPHIYAALMAQLPAKQHLLLSDLDKIKHDYSDHLEKVLTKFVSILSGIVEHGLAPRISKGTPQQFNFDLRVTAFPPIEQQQQQQATEGDNDDESTTTSITITVVPLCPFLDGVQTNTRKMHSVLKMLLPPDHLVDVFARIFLYLDQKIPVLFRSAAAATTQKNSSSSSSGGGDNDGTTTITSTTSQISSSSASTTTSFLYPMTDEGKRRMVDEVRQMTQTLNELSGVSKWEFSVMSQLERELGLEEEIVSSSAVVEGEANETENNNTTDETTTAKTTATTVDVDDSNTDHEEEGATKTSEAQNDDKDAGETGTVGEESQSSETKGVSSETVSEEDSKTLLPDDATGTNSDVTKKEDVDLNAQNATTLSTNNEDDDPSAVTQPPPQQQQVVDSNVTEAEP